TSNTPGRTQLLNFFLLGDGLHIVDLPGYGYAQVSRKILHRWSDMIFKYLRGRVQLRRVFLLIDSRHGLKDIDYEAMKQLDESAVSYQLVLTKTDKIPVSELAKRIQDTESSLKSHPAAFPTVLATSAIKKHGMDELRAAICCIL